MNLYNQKGWIGVDLDGTLAEYDGFKGIDHIGDPIPEMAERVHRWLAEGREVRIFTARVSENRMGGERDGTADQARQYIQRWLAIWGFPSLEITNVKDWAMDELWDDRCVQVAPNTGKPTCPSPRGLA